MSYWDLFTETSLCLGIQSIKSIISGLYFWYQYYETSVKQAVYIVEEQLLCEFQIFYVKAGYAIALYIYGIFRLPP